MILTERRRLLHAVGVLAFAFTTAFAVSAPAADWSLIGGFSQRFSADSNIQVEPDSDGGVFGSATDLNLTLTADTKSTTYFVTPGVSFRQFIGAGDDGDLDSIDPRLNAGFIHRGKLTNVSGNLFFTTGQTSFTQLEDTGLTETDARQFDFGGNVNVSHRVDERNTAAVNIFGNVTEFSDGGDEFEPNREFGVEPSWQRDLSENVSARGSLRIRRFEADSDTDPESWIFGPRVNFDISVNRRLSLSAGGGVSITSTERTESGVRTSETNIGGLGNFGLNYQTARSALELSLEQSLDAGSDGELDNLSSVGLDFSHILNSDYTFNFNSTVSRRDTVSGFEDESDETNLTFSFGPSLSYQITRDWSAQVGYRFVVADDDDGTGINNGVFFSIGRDFTFLP